MCRRFSVCAVKLTIIFILTPVSLAFGLLEDFNDGKADGWVEVQGEWRVENGKYVQEDIDWTTTATHET